MLRLLRMGHTSPDTTPRHTGLLPPFFQHGHSRSNIAGFCLIREKRVSPLPSQTVSAPLSRDSSGALPSCRIPRGVPRMTFPEGGSWTGANRTNHTDRAKVKSV